MKDEEKVEEYVKKFPFSNSNFQMFHKEHIEKIYLDGLAEGRKEKCFEQNKDGTIRPCEIMQENEELKEKVKGFESGNVAWQGDMDATIKQNMELKAQNEKLTRQNEKMKNFYNCAHSSRVLCPNGHKCKGCKEWELSE